jgi:hypothetical protein
MLGFFYMHTRKMLTVWLAIVVASSFLSAFARKLLVYRELKFGIHPLEIMFTGVIDAVFLTLHLFVPVFVAAVIIRYAIIRAKKIHLPHFFEPTFRRQASISLGLAILLGGFFYADIYSSTGYSESVMKYSAKVGVLAFAAVLFTFTALYGLIRGFSPIVRDERK